jgi:hypothetical protein
MTLLGAATVVVGAVAPKPASAEVQLYGVFEQIEGKFSDHVLTSGETAEPGLPLIKTQQPFLEGAGYCFTDGNPLFGCVKASGWISLFAYATLGALHTGADVFDQLTADKPNASGLAIVDAKAVASFNDIFFVASKKKPDGTPYLPDGTLLTLTAIFSLQSFEVGCGASSSTLTAQLGGPEGPSGRENHTGCGDVSLSSFVITAPIEVGFALPVTETLESDVITLATYPNDPQVHFSADASHTATLAVTLDSPYATYTTASGTIYPTEPPSETVVVATPEPAGALLLGTSLLGFAMIRRRVLT